MTTHVIRQAVLRCPCVEGVSKAQWEQGIRVEMEHTGNRRIARCIAAAHFAESPRYYDELAKMERKLKGRQRP
jgi:hypothetical protein